MKQFSINRFLQYTKLYLWSNKKTYLIMLAVYFGMQAVIGTITLLTEGEVIIALDGNIITPCVMLSVLVTGSFTAFHKKGSAALNIMLPASRNEKFWSITLVNLVLLPLVMLCAIYLSYVVFIGISNHPNDTFAALPNLFVYPSINMSITNNSVFVCSQPGIVLGSIMSYIFSILYCEFFALHFKRAHFWMSFLVYIAFLVVVVIVAIVFKDGLVMIMKDEKDFISNPMFFMGLFVYCAVPVLFYLNWRKFRLLGVKR